MKVKLDSVRHRKDLANVLNSADRFIVEDKSGYRIHLLTIGRYAMCVLIPRIGFLTLDLPQMLTNAGKRGINMTSRCALGFALGCYGS